MSKKFKKEPLPQDSFDMVNKCGTYEIQPTNGMENDFPQIAQGLPKTKKKNQKNK